MTKKRFPPDWDAARVDRVREYYEAQMDAEALAEDETSYENTTDTTMTVPVDIVPKVRELITRHRRRTA